MGSDARSPSVTDAAPPALVDDASLEGLSLGRYELGGLLGAGGMGAVYRGTDPILGRTVAIKVMRRHLAGSAGPEQLLAEAQAMARLSHPHIVTIYEAGLADDGRVYLAMEYVEGPTLRAWRAAGPRTWREIARVYADAARGLAAAHRAGLVHRDFKPDNVLIGDDGRVRVSDFGLAAARESVADDPIPPELSPGDTMRYSNAACGTPAYMAPEQHLRAPLTPSSDQFSFCVAVIEALQGRHPFAGSSSAEIRKRVLDGGILSALPQIKVPRRLRALLRRGLSLDPAARFPSMDAMADALLRELHPRRGIFVGFGAVVVAAGVTVAVWARPAEPVKKKTQGNACTGAVARGQLADVWDDSAKAKLHRAFLASGAASADAAFADFAQRMDRYTIAWVADKRRICLENLNGKGAPGQAECLNELVSRVRALSQVLRNPAASWIERAAPAVGQFPELATCGPGMAGSHAVPWPPRLDDRRRMLGMQRQLDRAHVLESLGEPVTALEVTRIALESTRDMAYNPARPQGLMLAGRLERATGDPAAAGHLVAALDAAANLYDADVAAEAFAELLLLPGSNLRCPTEEVVTTALHLDPPRCAAGGSPL